MKFGPATLGSLGILAGLLAARPAFAQLRERPWFANSPRLLNKSPASSSAQAPIAVDALSPDVRQKVHDVIQAPTLKTQAPAEEFPAGPYEWLLDHPDRVAAAWRRLGVPCVGITRRADGSFAWNDGQGSDLSWQCVWSAPAGRVWYAEGKARPGLHLPLIPVRAVAVLRCSYRREADGRLFATHDMDVYLQTDSRAAALVLKLIGPAAPHLAEQGAAQLLLFFSGIARHLDAHPEQTLSLLK